MFVSRSIRRAFLRGLTTFLIAIVPLTLWAKEPKVISLAAYPRVALLVCRMGSPDGVLKDIALETDYTAAVANAKQSLCIEDEAKLKVAFPNYPHMFSGRLPKTEEDFYRNLTQPLTGVLKTLLKERGKAVVDVRELSAGWPAGLDRINAILQRLGGQADALLVVHYIDSANRVYDAVNVARTDRGFSLLDLKLVLFDVASGKRVVGKEIMFNPLAIVAVDPGQKARVNVKPGEAKDLGSGLGFIIKERHGLFLSESTTTLISCSPSELEELAFGYLRTGYSGPSNIHRFQGLNQLIP
jgi:hypothetical protein